MGESFDRLKQNVEHINSGQAKHPAMEQDHPNGVEAGKELYHRFYGKKQP